VENFIDCIYTSRTGSLWFGTRSNGLFWHNARTGEWANYTAENSLSSNTIISIFAESDSNVWVATDQDICHFDGRSWVANVFPAHIKMTSSGGSLSISRDGSLWINHRSRTWNRRTLYPGATLRESREWFRTIRYQPDHQPPETYITFSQDRISQPGNVLLSWIAHDPWQSTPDQQLQYSYRMDQQPWCDYTSKTSEIFLSVGDGEHTFEVRARDRDMNVDPVPARVSFYVTPPTWKQTWFIALITAFLVTILYFIFHLMHRNNIIKQLSEAKVRLFTNISHEFRTPLTLILGPLQQVQHALRPKDPLQRPLHVMYHNGLRLMRLVNQLLDFQKIEAGQLRLEPGQDDVMGFIRKVASDFETMARDKHIDFRIATNPDQCQMSFDPDKLEKILYNLLANAFKFTHNEGHIRVSAAIVTSSEADPSVRQAANGRQEMKKRLTITVQDDGIGIPQKQLPHIFNRFYQVDDRSHFHRGGTGIGLALVKELVALHNGEIDVQSQMGVGTTFQIMLPLVQTGVAHAVPSQDRLAPGAALATEPISIAHLEEPRAQAPKCESVILLVEDNADMRQFIRHDLESRYRIREAANGREAIELAIEPPCDLIISDVMMPEMNGIELCKILKQDERTSHIPIILLTARSSHVHKIEGLEIGADDYITKPFHTRELEIRIHNLIQSRKLLQERFSRQIKVEPKEITITPTDEKILRRAIDCLEQHMDDQEYGVEAFSRDMGMSRVGLYNKLKALTNQSVQEFIFNIRLKRAAQLLRDSDLTITEISFQVGFKDSSHFTKLFKKQFGVPPSSFNKTYQQMDSTRLDS
jgi:signal transduction histidine kinase/DNA-binding response OmpR family regulator